MTPWSTVLRRWFVASTLLILCDVAVAGMRVPPAKRVFSGEMLTLAQAIRRGDIAKVETLEYTVELNQAGKDDMTLFAAMCVHVSRRLVGDWTTWPRWNSVVSRTCARSASNSRRVVSNDAATVALGTASPVSDGGPLNAIR